MFLVSYNNPLLTPTKKRHLSRFSCLLYAGARKRERTSTIGSIINVAMAVILLKPPLLAVFKGKQNSITIIFKLLIIPILT